MADVRLVDLDVFKRYSLAIRQETAPLEEVLAVLDATRRQVEAARRPNGRLPRRRRAGAAGGPAPAEGPEQAPGDGE